MLRSVFLGLPAALALGGRLVEASVTVGITAILLWTVESAFIDDNALRLGVVLLLLFLVLQSVAGVLTAWLDARWSLAAVDRFQSCASEMLRNRTDLHRDGTPQRRSSHGLAGATVETIDGICQYSSDYVFLAAVTCGTAIVLGLQLGLEVSGGMVVGLLLALLLVALSARRVASYADKRTRSRWSLGEHVQLGWAAMTSADALTKNIWLRSLNRYFFVYSNVIKGQALYVTGIQAIIRLCCLFGPIIPLTVIALDDIGGPLGTAALVALPRLITVSNQFSQAASMTAAMPEMRGRWRALCRFLPEDGKDQPLPEPILHAGDEAWSLLLVGEDGMTMPFTSSTLPRSGRLRIVGPNGSGKTTALLRLKNEFGDRAALFTNETLGVLAARGQHGSSGENKLRALQRFMLHRAEDVVLLDEWESRLDDATRERIDLMITDLSKAKLFVEVRHVP